jgi:hypothetical protein
MGVTTEPAPLRHQRALQQGFVWEVVLADRSMFVVASVLRLAASDV